MSATHFQPTGVRIMKRLLCLALAAMGLAGFMSRSSVADDKGAAVKLFNGNNLDGWKVFLDPKKKADPEKIWSVHDGVIVCEGSVNGYLITEKEYENYELRLQWRWGEKVHVKYGRNSGVFVHVVGPDKIWPKAVEAQLMANHAGDFWLVDGFKLTVDSKRQDPKVDRHYYRLKDDVEKKLGEWNQYVITCKGKTVHLEINGHFVNQGTDAELTKGKILLQSEGAEIHFRNVELRPVD